jgi:hypothetical protein
MSEDITGGRRDAPRKSAQQVARIAVLLGELEELSRAAAQVPAPLLIQTRASIERALCVLENYEQFAERVASEKDDDGDPQPDVDDDLLERMYRTLGTGRRPPER